MNEYDFTSLNDKEFEVLVADLVSEVENCRVERFKSGRDGGVDGRFYSIGNSEVIIQCKHWAKSGLKNLINHLKNSEVYKVRKLNPERYIFATSVELSRNDKAHICNLFKPYIRTNSDVLGKEDLNDLLSKNKQVELRHYKLWITSTNVLSAILSSGVIGRSREKIREIKDRLPLYVATEGHEKAKDLLQSMGAIIITGEPGIGKTTLADYLCLDYLAMGYELCYIENSIDEAEQLFDRNARQIFYFDDFLGRNYLQALQRHEDSHVIRFINRVCRSRHKRFILTSRSTVLNQGKRLTELFRIENVGRSEYELRIDALCSMDKARILYNHIWFGTLGNEYIDEIYKEKRYQKIISHRNYNPRLISFVTDAYKLGSVSPKGYWDYVTDMLENPSDIWEHVYDYQLDDHARLLTLLVSFNGEPIEEDDLKAAFITANRMRNKECEFSDYYSTIKLAVGSVINRKLAADRGIVKYDLFNPALADYLLRRFCEDSSVLLRLFRSLDTDESLMNLRSLYNEEIINVSILDKIVANLYEFYLTSHSIQQRKSSAIKAIDLAIDKIQLNLEELQLLGNWLSQIDYEFIDSNNHYYLCGIVYFALTNDVVDIDSLRIDSLLETVISSDTEHDTLVGVGRLLDYLGDDWVAKHYNRLENAVIDYWSLNIESDISSEGTLSAFFYDDQTSDAEEALRSHVGKVLREYSVEFDDSVIDEICDVCDVESIIESNRQDAAAEDHFANQAKESRRDSIHALAEIDNLFDRK
ncbi:restriction endonuclease [Parahaliea mediterranea]|uniref:nSTAND3 domain-containing NTPase n=1 Tax=Parahaliea mediterranea TaxID=651086 RepID=UPI000E2F67E3|nr:restriction endonuclease [Parahaliea mediterranea]